MRSVVTARRTATGAGYAAGVRRLLLLVAAAVLAGCASGTTGTPEPETVTPEPAAIQTTDAPEPTEATQSPTEPSVEAFAPIELSGDGKEVVEFTIPEGEAAIADLTHDGDDNFIVIPFTADGERLSSLVIETGEYAGAVIFNTRPEEQAAALEIEADGAWTIAIKPITAAKVWDTATSLDGTGDDVYQLDPPPAGLVTLDLAYQGDDNFIIPYTADGGADRAAW